MHEQTKKKALILILLSNYLPFLILLINYDGKLAHVSQYADL
jgi:hypothetical protein